MSRLNSRKNGSPGGCLSPAPTRSLKVKGLTIRFEHFRKWPKGFKNKTKQDIAPHFVFVIMFLFVITKLELLAVINLLVEPFKREKQSTSALRDERRNQRNESPPISFHRPAHPSSQSLSSSSKSFRSSGLMIAGREGLSTGLRMGWEDSRRGARTKRFSFFTSPLNHRL